jgi:hypothetical protein
VQDSPKVERENIGDDFSRLLLPVLHKSSTLKKMLDFKWNAVPDVLKLDHHSFVIEPLSIRASLPALRLVECVFDRHEQGGEKAAAVTFILFSFFGHIMIFK